jgi:hypothetical protein
MNIRLHGHFTETIPKQTGYGVTYHFKLTDFLSGQVSWDYYRVNALVVKFIPRTSPSHPGEDNGRALCACAVDLDDDTKPTSITDLANYQNCKIFRSDQIFSIKWRPAILLDVDKGDYKSPLAAGIKKKQWLNSSYKEIMHRGLKVWLANNSLNHETDWDILVTAYVSFKQPLIRQSFTTGTDTSGFALGPVASLPALKDSLPWEHVANGLPRDSNGDSAPATDEWGIDEGTVNGDCRMSDTYWEERRNNGVPDSLF